MSGQLELQPISIKAALRFVRQHHRHHPRCAGGLFAVAAAADGVLAGVAIVGRPVARGLQDGQTAEVTRLCTLGQANLCSMLYRAAWRACRALGYRRLVTYTLATESGISLRASGFHETGRVKARSWDCPSRPRTDHAPPRGEDSLGAGCVKRESEVLRTPMDKRRAGAGFPGEGRAKDRDRGDHTPGRAVLWNATDVADFAPAPVWGAYPVGFADFALKALRCPPPRGAARV